jgi:voltage-gated potassium channel
VRGVRTAARTLSSRLAWLGAVTAIVILCSGQLLFEFGGYDDYGQALHDAAYATITGEPIPEDGGLPDVLELVLALYAVVVFAVLAGALGAYFLERTRAEQTPTERHTLHDDQLPVGHS